MRKETTGKDKGQEENKEKDQLPLKKSLLSKELQDKFTEMKNCTSFEEREQVLRWAVEEMRSEVVEHLEASDALQDMSESQKMQILQQIDDLHSQCKDELFQMHKDQAEGKYVEKTSSFTKLLKQIDSLKSKIQIV